MFDFAAEAKKYSKIVIEKTMKDICNSKSCKKNKDSSRNMGVYALYCNGELMKIGKAVTGDGIFTRMKQYYYVKPEGISEITTKNRDDVMVKYFNLEDKKECWAAEKFMQVRAYECGENMPWDHELNPLSDGNTGC